MKLLAIIFNFISPLLSKSLLNFHIFHQFLITQTQCVYSVMVLFYPIKRVYTKSNAYSCIRFMTS
jgi:hypothetical protein